LCLDQKDKSSPLSIFIAERRLPPGDHEEKMK